MIHGSKSSLPSLLIVEADNGNVFIIENKDSQSQVDKILKSERSEQSKKVKILKPKNKDEDTTPPLLSTEIREEEEEIQLMDFLDCEKQEESDISLSQVSFVDLKQEYDISKPSITACITKENNQSVKTKTENEKSSTFNGHWSDDETNDNSFQESMTALPNDKRSSDKQFNTGLSEENKNVKNNFRSHKMRSLVGKIACKYCDTIFPSKAEQSMHVCPYLQCDPKNFICRICKKELSRKTFSNHLHETLDCQYCGKKFINPRNMKSHIEKQHQDEDFIPPVVKDNEEYLKTKICYEESLKSQEAMRSKDNSRVRKKERFECDLCGKYLASLRSMSFHMSLHTGNSVYICENCGEKFFTPNGIKGHSCEKKRRRPEKDFRTYDLRHCRFCDSYFGSYDENKAHACIYQYPEDPKMIYCRSCGKLLAKLAFNRHFEIHSGVDWICSVCCRKLATERALKVHMTTHTGNKPYKCKLCTDSFINKVVLERHMRFHGASTKVFRCEYCFKELSTETSLRNHVQRLHKTTVQCELCKAEFLSREDLKSHLDDSHEPSLCSICHKSFALPRYLKMHEKLHYEDSIARIQCSFCSKLLGIKNIKSHIFRHHPEQFELWQQANPTL